MQINANYSVNGVPYDNKRKQNNIPQFSTECAVQENENINPYMAEADFDEKAFDMIGPNAPQDVKGRIMGKSINLQFLRLHHDMFYVLLLTECFCLS